MRASIPPVSAIRVFEAAAYHRNFTKAGEELGMTQAAVSYQIKLLEDRVGATLFERRPRGVALTGIGDQLARGTFQAFDQLREVFARIDDDADDTLTITSTPTFAVQFLASRLGAFQLAHPKFAVKVEVTQALADFRSDGIDLGIRTGHGAWPGLKAHKLFDCLSTPILTPALVASVGGISAPADLLKLPIIDSGDGWWEAWFTAAGVTDVSLPAKPRLDFAMQAAEANAALAGRGVGRLSPALYRMEIEQGRLVRPFELALADGPPLWLVYPQARFKSPKINAFRKWIGTEIQATA